MLDSLRIYKKCPQYRLRNGLKINLVKREKNDLTTDLLIDVFVNKDYGEIGNNLTIIDIGANIGAFSMHAVNNKNNYCYAFEPEYSNYARLEENIKLNNLTSKIKAFNMAVSDSCEDMKLYKFESIAHSTVRKGEKYDVVHCIDLKSIIEKNNIKYIDFLKIDCEGAEFDILYNASSEFFERVKFLCFEYHNYSDKPNYKGHDLIKYIKNCGFNVIEHIVLQNGIVGIVKATNKNSL